MSTLHDAFEEILDTIVAEVTAAASDDGLLAEEGISEITRGDRGRVQPRPPAVWVIPREAKPIQEQFKVETWSLPIDVAGVALVGNDPEEAARVAQRIAAKARYVALHFDVDPLETSISKVESVGFTPTRPIPKNKLLAYSFATIRVVFDVEDLPWQA